MVVNLEQFKIFDNLYDHNINNKSSFSDDNEDFHFYLQYKKTGIFPEKKYSSQDEILYIFIRLDTP